MTTSLRSVAIQQFSDIFIQVYQQSNFKLGGTSLERRGIVGEAFVDKVIGESIMKKRTADQSFIPASEVTHTPVSTTFTDWVDKLPTDIFAQAEVNVDERSELANLAVLSVNRRQDQIIIDALNASTTSNVIADGGVNLTVDKLLEAMFALDAANVDGERRYFAAHASQKQALLESTEVTNANYNTVRALVNGELDTFLGFNFIWFGNMAEGGIPKTGDIRTAFAWQQKSMRSGWGDVSRGNPGLIVDFDPNRVSDIVIPTLRMGAKELLSAGIVKVNCNEA
jgi:hypothetical protein